MRRTGVDVAVETNAGVGDPVADGVIANGAGVGVVAVAGERVAVGPIVGFGTVDATPSVDVGPPTGSAMPWGD